MLFERVLLERNRKRKGKKPGIPPEAWIALAILLIVLWVIGEILVRTGYLEDMDGSLGRPGFSHAVEKLQQQNGAE